MTTTLITNVRVIDAQTDVIKDVFIKDGKFSEMPEALKADEVIDGRGLQLFPGCIDPHVHFREPGFEYKEDLESGSRAAVSAGVTSFFDMPNTDPPTFTRELLADKKALAQGRSWAHYGFYFGSGPDNQSEIEQVEGIPGTKLYLNTTTGNLRMDNEDRWREIFKVGKPVALHAEGPVFQRAVDVWLEEGSPCHLHLCHASLRREVELVRTIKKNSSLKSIISIEVCPHHLFMTHEDREKHGAFCCMKPELATQDDLDAMWEGVEDGTIDFFATDHAPHTKAEKDLMMQYWPEPKHVFYGIPGVETFFPLLYTEFVKRQYDLRLLSAMTSANTFKNFKVTNKQGLIKNGYEADFFMYDPTIKKTVKATELQSKCEWTPFEGYPLTGQLQSTWVKGQLKFAHNKFMGTANGEALIFQALPL
jgi:dihydroorotase